MDSPSIRISQSFSFSFFVSLSLDCDNFRGVPSQMCVQDWNFLLVPKTTMISQSTIESSSAPNFDWWKANSLAPGKRQYQRNVCLSSLKKERSKYIVFIFLRMASISIPRPICLYHWWDHDGSYTYLVESFSLTLSLMHAVVGAVFIFLWRKINWVCGRIWSAKEEPLRVEQLNLGEQTPGGQKKWCAGYLLVNSCPPILRL